MTGGVSFFYLFAFSRCEADLNQKIPFHTLRDEMVKSNPLTRYDWLLLKNVSFSFSSRKIFMKK